MESDNRLNTFSALATGLTFATVGWVTGWFVGSSQSPVIAGLLPLIFGLIGGVGVGFYDKRAAHRRVLESIGELTEAQKLKVEGALGNDRRPRTVPLAWLLSIAAFCVSCFFGNQYGISIRVNTYPPLASFLDQEIDDPTRYAQLQHLLWDLRAANVPPEEARTLLRESVVPVLDNPLALYQVLEALRTGEVPAVPETTADPVRVAKQQALITRLRQNAFSESEIQNLVDHTLSSSHSREENSVLEAITPAISSNASAAPTKASTASNSSSRSSRSSRIPLQSPGGNRTEGPDLDTLEAPVEPDSNDNDSADAALESFRERVSTLQSLRARPGDAQYFSEALDRLVAKVRNPKNRTTHQPSLHDWVDAQGGQLRLKKDTRHEARYDAERLEQELGELLRQYGASLFHEHERVDSETLDYLNHPANQNPHSFRIRRHQEQNSLAIQFEFKELPWTGEASPEEVRTFKSEFAPKALGSVKSILDLEEFAPSGTTVYVFWDDWSLIDVFELD